MTRQGLLKRFHSITLNLLCKLKCTNALAVEPIGQGGQLAGSCPPTFCHQCASHVACPTTFFAPRNDNFSWQSRRKWALLVILCVKWEQRPPCWQRLYNYCSCTPWCLQALPQQKEAYPRCTESWTSGFIYRLYTVSQKNMWLHFLQ